MSEEVKAKPCVGCASKQKRLYRISELPIYGNPHPPSDAIKLEEVGYIESGVKIARESVGQYLSLFGDAYQRTRQFVSTAVEHSKTTYKYVSDEANTVPKAVAITGGGFLGLLLASRKGFFKRITYTSVGLLASAAVCYPQQSKELGQVGFYIVKTKGPEIIKEYSGIDLSDRLKSLIGKSKSEPKTGDDIADEVSDVQYYGFRLPVKESKKEITATSKVIHRRATTTPKDFGQSNKEDKDLYANRSTK